MVQSLIAEYSVRLCFEVTDCRIHFETVGQSQIVQYIVRLVLSLTVGYVRLCDAVTDCTIQRQTDAVSQSVTDCRIHRQTVWCSH